ncbi:MAG: ATP-binding protein [Candidatus Zixiibacteriota bacterium]
MQDLPLRKSSIRFILSINPRLFLLIGASLAALFLTIVVIGIRENRSNVIRMMKDEARALVESVILASSNTLAATDMVDNMVLDNLSDVASLTGRRFQQGDLGPQELAAICQTTGINRMDVLDSVGRVAISSVNDLIGQSYDSTVTDLFPFEEILMGQVRSASFILDDDNPVIPPQIVLAASRMDEPGAVVVFADYSILERFSTRIGIGSLIQRIGSQPGMEYVFLQSEQGVVFSSRSIGQVLRIEADEFLQEIVLKGGYGSRVIEFEGREVLEVVRPFDAEGLPPGVLRIGLSMAGYEQVTGNFEAQLIAIGAILFIASFLVVVFFLANLNYRTLESMYMKMKTVTGNILDAMQSAVVVTDDSGIITLFNPRAEEMFGYRASDVVGRDYRDVFDGDPLMLDKVGALPDLTIRTEKRVSLADGRQLDLLIAASRVIRDGGGVIGSVSVIYDVTESKKLERSSKRSERLSELGNLAAGVAHEIRNPLNAISIASQRLKSEFSPTSDAKEYGQLVGNIKSEIERLNGIIDQFLALAKTHVARRELCDLSALVREIAELMRPVAETKGIVFELTVEDGLLVEGSADELKKVLINLVKNSIEACIEKDVVRIDANLSSGATATVRVIDTGAGVEMQDREKIFRPYFTTKTNGTGLGLALSHRIVSDHDGTMEYEENPGGGAIFLVTLPAVKEVKK